ncbi:MAG: hypothetical protein F7C07_04805 [Desulfurococcales archaeon]|nr:hypothetical protein [Desulfurococcales archaeon]
MSSELDTRFARIFVAVAILFALMLLAITIVYVDPLLTERAPSIGGKRLASVEIGSVRISLEEYGFAERLCVENVSLKDRSLYFIVLVETSDFTEARIGIPRLTVSNISYEPVELDDVVFHVGKKPDDCDIEIDNANITVKFLNSVKPPRAEGRIVIAFTGVNVGVPMSLVIPVEILPSNSEALFSFNITIYGGTSKVVGASVEVR